MKIVPKTGRQIRESSTKKEDIGYAMKESSLGLILVATSNAGVVSVLVGNNAKQLVAELQDSFKRACLHKNDPKSKSALKHVFALVKKPGRAFTLPLDVRGTDFQRKVWQAAWEIPLGKTTTYSQIARKIGKPRAMRAVGNACSNNKFALIVPCYKVLRSDGTMSKRQRRLIEWELGGKPVSKSM
jgi:AraC family transcriptional regulator, regulatory protein of adaptative response / methylated-DNA-[protein]-cysteine methyltransferase